uniref:Uncharacterized protein n=1 Tax=Dromaius novaehollandiae TaxID=8790 RepID=A0A8C4JFI5_DRONO
MPFLEIILFCYKNDLSCKCHKSSPQSRPTASEVPRTNLSHICVLPFQELCTSASPYLVPTKAVRCSSCLKKPMTLQEMVENSSGMLWEKDFDLFKVSAACARCSADRLCLFLRWVKWRGRSSLSSYPAMQDSLNLILNSITAFKP